MTVYIFNKTGNICTSLINYKLCVDYHPLMYINTMHVFVSNGVAKNEHGKRSYCSSKVLEHLVENTALHCLLIKSYVIALTEQFSTCIQYSVFENNFE